MKKLNELPKKNTPETEDPKRKKSSPSAPAIETPTPPQVMDPSVPLIERKKTATSPGKQKKSN